MLKENSIFLSAQGKMLYLMDTLIKGMPSLCRTDYGFTSVLEKQGEVSWSL